MSDTDQIRLSEKQAECILFIEQVYMTEGIIPSAKKISDTFGTSVETAKKWLASPQFNVLLASKGIKKPGTLGVLSAPQLYISNLMLNLNDKRSLREKCEAAGITTQQLAVWQRDDTFKEYMRKRAEALFHDSDDAAYLNVIKNVQAGDLQAAKFYFEMTGKYQPSKSRGDVNLESFIASVIEIIQYRVSDSATLELIANDLESLLSGKPVVLDRSEAPMAIEATSAEAEAAPLLPDKPQWKALVGDGELKFRLDLGGS